MSSADAEEFLEALQELTDALDGNLERARRMQERARELCEAIRGGRPLAEIVPQEETPLLVELLTESAEVLHTYGARVRRTEARALYREGMTMDRIARLFGVSRQRVSALLRDDPAAGEPPVD